MSEVPGPWQRFLVRQKPSSVGGANNHDHHGGKQSVWGKSLESVVSSKIVFFMAFF